MSSLRPLHCLLAVVLLLIPCPVRAGEEAEALIARERVRAEVDSILTELHSPSREGKRVFYWAVDSLVALGPAAVPFIVAELESESSATYHIAAYALGLIGGPEAADALEESYRKAEAASGPFAAARAERSAHALALMGRADAVVKVLDSRHRILGRVFMDRASVLEVVAVLTYPHSVEPLIAQLRSYAAGEPDPDMLFTLRALRRIGDPAARDVLLPVLGHERPEARGEAALALGVLADPSTADPLLGLLRDPDRVVRRAAAEALNNVRPVKKLKAILAHLEVEENSSVRRLLYRAVAGLSGESALPLLRQHWGRADYLDRMAIIDTVRDIGSRKGINLLRVAVHDQDETVRLRALRALSDLGDAAARNTLLAYLQEADRNILGAAVNALTKIGEARAAPRIAHRLLQEELPARASDHRSFLIDRMGDALVDLRYTEPLPDHREALEDEGDARAAEHLRGAVRRLALLKDLGDDAEGWIEAARSEDSDVRLLAYDRLGELGGREALAGLERAFETAERIDRLEILRTIARMASPDAAPWVEKILLSPEWDDYERRNERSMAAWAARRIGGENMISALRRSAERRRGRDVDVLVYLAILAGPDAIPTLRAYRIERMRYFQFDRSLEHDRLEWILRELSAGRPIPSLDAPPHRNALTPWWIKPRD